MQIYIYSKNNKIKNTLEQFIYTFFEDKEITYTITKISDEIELNNISDYDLIFFDTDQKPTDNIDFKNTHIIKISDIFYYTLNNISNENILFKPLKYDSFYLEFNSIFEKFVSKNKKASESILSKIKLFNKKKSNNKESIDFTQIKNITYIHICSNKHFIIHTKNKSYNVYDSIEIYNNTICTNLFRCNNNHLISLQEVSRIGKYFIEVNFTIISVDKNKFNPLKEELIKILKISFNS